MNKKIERFTDLIAWKEAHKLVLSIYEITKTFPSVEKFCLIDQMRRCVISVTSNIAEGFSRRNKREKNQFYYIALGSLTELQNQLIIARDLHYISPEFFNSVIKQTIMVHKLLNGLIKSSQTYT